MQPAVFPHPRLILSFQLYDLQYKLLLQYDPPEIGHILLNPYKEISLPVNNALVCRYFTMHELVVIA